ncbi:MAG: phosphatase PAP2 family protein [Actinomycetota bacterium]|nr:phosphatase PAP2 family protein [Actinomycetota bacterium]
MSEHRSEAEARSDQGERREAPRALRRRLDPDSRYGLRLTLFAVAFLLVAVPFGLLLDQVQRSGWMIGLDTSAARHLPDWARQSDGLVRALKIVTFFGSPLWFYLIVTPAVLWVWRRGHPRLAVFLVVTALAGGLLGTVVKEAVGRPRPSLVEPVATASGKSFPSGHAMSSTVAYGALLLVFLPAVGRRYRPVVVAGTVVLVAAIGFSRLALGVHYITDVLGGYVLGLAWLAASTAAFRTWRVDRARPPVDVDEGLEPEAADGLFSREPASDPPPRRKATPALSNEAEASSARLEGRRVPRPGGS